MKPQRFEIGQEIMLRKGHKVRPHPDQPPSGNLNDHTVYHVKEYGKTGFQLGCMYDYWFLVLVEFPTSLYREDIFDPVISSKELETMLEEIAEPQTA